MGVVSFDCSEFTSHHLLAVPMPPVLAYYSNMVLPPGDALHHLISVIALTEFAACTAMHSLLTTRDGVLLTHRLGTALQLKFPVILPVLIGCNRLSIKLNFLKSSRIPNSTHWRLLWLGGPWRAFIGMNWQSRTMFRTPFFSRNTLVSFHFE